MAVRVSKKRTVKEMTGAALADGSRSLNSSKVKVSKKLKLPESKLFVGSQLDGRNIK